MVRMHWHLDDYDLRAARVRVRDHLYYRLAQACFLPTLALRREVGRRSRFEQREIRHLSKPVGLDWRHPDLAHLAPHFFDLRPDSPSFDHHRHMPQKFKLEPIARAHLITA